MKKNLTEIYFIRITKEMNDEIVELGHLEDRNKSNMTRILIREALNNRKKLKKDFQ